MRPPEIPPAGLLNSRHRLFVGHDQLFHHDWIARKDLELEVCCEAASTLAKTSGQWDCTWMPYLSESGLAPASGSWRPVGRSAFTATVDRPNSDLWP